MTSIEAFANTTPVNPPVVNKKINPNAHNIGVELKSCSLPLIVDIHLYTFTPVGIAIIIVAFVKNARASTSIPTKNIWCPHTTIPV